jgi:hypothetical protein
MILNQIFVISGNLTESYYVKALDIIIVCLTSVAVFYWAVIYSRSLDRLGSLINPEFYKHRFNARLKQLEGLL